MNKNERAAALHILSSFIKKKIALPYLFTQQTGTSPAVKNMCYGVCRYYFQLEALADFFLKKRPKSEAVWASLLTGLYELHYLHKPEHAVVKETVALMDKVKAPWAKGLINACLRNSIRQFDTASEILTTHEVYRWNHPQWFIKAVQQQYPEDWQHILQENDRHPPMSLRVNTQAISRDNYLKTLEKAHMVAHAHPLLPEALILEKPCLTNELSGFIEGQVSVQDVAAQLAAHLLDLKNTVRLLDACAAPGGKTCHILERYNDLHYCLALEIDAYRIKKIQDNFDRLALKADIKQADASQPAQWWDGQAFDRILLDAPCTASGVIRRNPDIKVLRQPEELKQVCNVQANLLKALWPLLAVGGKLLYATCSIFSEENENQIEAFLKTHTNASVSREKQAWAMNKTYGWQVLPGQHQMDGFYYCLLTKEKS